MNQVKGTQLSFLHNTYTIAVEVVGRTSPKLAKIQQACSALALRLGPLRLPDLAYCEYSAPGGLFHRFFFREGREDLESLECWLRCIYRPYRVPDPELAHLYHTMQCERKGLKRTMGHV